MNADPQPWREVSKMGPANGGPGVGDKGGGGQSPPLSTFLIKIRIRKNVKKEPDLQPCTVL